MRPILASRGVWQTEIAGSIEVAVIPTHPRHANLAPQDKRSSCRIPRIPRCCSGLSECPPRPRTHTTTYIAFPARLLLQNKTQKDLWLSPLQPPKNQCSIMIDTPIVYYGKDPDLFSQNEFQRSIFVCTRVMYFRFLFAPHQTS